MRIIVCLTLLGTLAACGGSSGSEDTRIRNDIIERAEAAAAMVEELEALPATIQTEMPTTGSATFAGFAGLVIDPIAAEDTDDVVLLGDVSITATFAGNGSVTGVADNFAGVVGSDGDGQFVTAGGQIDIGDTSSAIGQGGDLANEWQSSYSGRVTVEGETYDVSGTLDGGFLGNRTEQPAPETYIEGIYGFDDSGLSLDSDGDDAPVLFEVLGTNPV